MIWKQLSNPLENVILSALLAFTPILFIFWALVIAKWKGYIASIAALLTAMAIAVLLYGMPSGLAVMSAAHGMVYGLFPIGWIVISAVFLFNLTVESGKFEIIKDFMSSITEDRRLQAVLIAFCFGSFLEGMAGFGAPVAITAAMLVGLGFKPLNAAGICLIANTAPVAFGSIGIPITVASEVSGVPELTLSQMVGRTLPILALFIPFYLVLVLAGFKRAREVWPAVLICGGTFGVLQFLTANYLGPALPNIIAGIGSIVTLILLLRLWKPRDIWKLPHDNPELGTKEKKSNSRFQIIKASSPFILLTIIVIAWGIGPVKKVLDSMGMFQFEVPYLHNAIQKTDGELIGHILQFNLLSAAGTAIILTTLISVPILGIRYREASKIFLKTLGQLKYALITIASIMGFAYVMNDSGITNTLAETLALSGVLFPLFAPVLGWLGVFITGSDASANALFGNLQVTAANTMGIDPAVTVAANASGGVVGKMISPHSLAVATAAGGLIGQESKLFRYTLKHSLIFLVFISFLVFAQAYWLTDWIPSYGSMGSNLDKVPAPSWNGFMYLGILFLLITAFLLYIFTNRQHTRKTI
jgi:lactate permease